MLLTYIAKGGGYPLTWPNRNNDDQEQKREKP